MEETLEPQDGALNGANRMKGRKQERVYSKHILPSNRHTFQIQSDVLRRFVTLGRNGGIAASQTEGEGVPVQASSMNVRFMRDIGLLTPTARGMYAPTPEAIQFVNAKSVSDEKAKPILASLLSKTWFAELAQSTFATQPIMTEDQFLGEMALAAQTDKSKEEPALRVILEYLVYSGILIRDDRGLCLNQIPGQPLQDALTPAERTMPMIEKGVVDVATIERPSAAIGWHAIQTEDFTLKVRSDLDVVQDLIDHLETLKKKITRLRKAAEQKQSAPTDGNEE